MPVADIFRTYLGAGDAPAGGRDLHVGDLEYGVLAPISHVGDVVPVIAGVALSFQIRGEDRVGLTWVGDGSTKTAAFHEGINLDAVGRPPRRVIITNTPHRHGPPSPRRCPRPSPSPPSAASPPSSSSRTTRSPWARGSRCTPPAPFT